MLLQCVIAFLSLSQSIFSAWLFLYLFPECWHNTICSTLAFSLCLSALPSPLIPQNPHDPRTHKDARARLVCVFECEHVPADLTGLDKKDKAENTRPHASVLTQRTEAGLQKHQNRSRNQSWERIRAESKALERSKQLLQALWQSAAKTETQLCIYISRV